MTAVATAVAVADAAASATHGTAAQHPALELYCSVAAVHAVIHVVSVERGFVCDYKCSRCHLSGHSKPL